MVRQVLDVEHWQGENGEGGGRREEGGRRRDEVGNTRAGEKVRADYDLAAQWLVGLPAILPNSGTPWGGDRVLASDQDSPTPPPQNRKLVK